MGDIFVNLACTLQSLLRSPSWYEHDISHPLSQPQIHAFDAGALATSTTTGACQLEASLSRFVMSWLHAIIVIALSLVIYEYIEFTVYACTASLSALTFRCRARPESGVTGSGG